MSHHRPLHPTNFTHVIRAPHHRQTAMVVIATLAALVLLRYGAILFLAALVIRPVRDCPACSGDTVEVRRALLRPIARHYEWRWCPGCGWQALARRIAR